MPGKLQKKEYAQHFIDKSVGLMDKSFIRFDMIFLNPTATP
jgi:hypothetical protein